jgi:hypothetical protein
LGSRGYATQVHRLWTRHPSQSRENFSHHEDGADLEPKGGAADHGCLTGPVLSYFRPRTKLKFLAFL